MGKPSKMLFSRADLRDGRTGAGLLPSNFLHCLIFDIYLDDQGRRKLAARYFICAPACFLVLFKGEQSVQ